MWPDVGAFMWPDGGLPRPQGAHLNFFELIFILSPNFKIEDIVVSNALVTGA